ncbi:gluconate 2-dehydrogenase subunit 3 family protein [Lacihabitans sp. CCS-44]|uniref:gluconate 2-dehydrogenase subunit 3 family protein n=1 Tax=Lacihabitans sp. CCS-44 TaxID=2487331 RepID=UPI0020CC8B72|nr:gluconate 2-dehydrogenase subunit 3 family protein [Lacihabitans sp. CCS-44]MCP9754668.1 gluconate 2-dehydrogenase subunit 3 family protein [Lacihabitans sp. CCS-44]
MNRRDYIKNTAAALGLTLTGISMSEMLLSCQTQANLDWKPAFFTNNQAALIADIAESILPKTKTPGAKEMAVPQFIDKMVKETMDEASQKSLVEGLESFEDEVKAKYDTNFILLKADQKKEFLEKLDKEKPRSGLSMWGIALEKDAPQPTFFKIIKGLTLFGFYTSEEIGRNVLVYDPVPGEYIGCMPLKGQNSWTE